MITPTRRVRKTLEIKIMFEPTRLAAEPIIDAYLKVVPLRRRSLQAASEQEKAHETCSEIQ